MNHDKSPSLSAWAKLKDLASAEFSYAAADFQHGATTLPEVAQWAQLVATIDGEPDPTRERLRALVDAVWNHATESTTVPDRRTADALINRVMYDVEPAPGVIDESYRQEPGQAAPPELTDERIDRIAELVLKSMPDGIAGFCKTWGWRQFARALLDVCSGHVRAQAAPFLFIAMDDDGVAHAQLCRDQAAVLAAVKGAVFFTMPAQSLSEEHEQEARGIAETLLDDGVMRFEGDPPLYLFRLDRPIAMPGEPS